MNTLGSALLLGLLSTPAFGGSTLSESALRFYGTGVGPPGQQDRVLIPVDDNVPGASSSPIDVGAGSFTLEFWLRGLVADNPTANAGGDVELFDYSWIDGNIILDRDVWCGTANAFGVSLAGGFVRFGVDSGDAGPSNDTIEGNVDVLDGEWHHVAVVRDAVVGDLTIVVDGVEDFRGSAGISTADLSYPDAGIPVTGDCDTGQRTPYGWYLVVAAEKHDAGPSYPSFAGFVDELRIWNVARSAADIADTRRRVLPPATPGLVGNYRFEEGSGTVVTDSSGFGSPSGELRSGVAGNGEWVHRLDDAANTAPIGSLLFADGFESGDLNNWSSGGRTSRSRQRDSSRRGPRPVAHEPLTSWFETSSLPNVLSTNGWLAIGPASHQEDRGEALDCNSASSLGDDGRRSDLSRSFQRQRRGLVSVGKLLGHGFHR